jgi:hypothetical protein
VTVVGVWLVDRTELGLPVKFGGPVKGLGKQPFQVGLYLTGWATKIDPALGQTNHPGPGRSEEGIGGRVLKRHGYFNPGVFPLGLLGRDRGV